MKTVFVLFTLMSSLATAETITSNFQIYGYCDFGQIVVLLTGDRFADYAKDGTMVAPENSSIVVMPCQMKQTLKDCASKRGAFTLLDDGSVTSSIKARDFQCL